MLALLKRHLVHRRRHHTSAITVTAVVLVTVATTVGLSATPFDAYADQVVVSRADLKKHGHEDLTRRESEAAQQVSEAMAHMVSLRHSGTEAELKKATRRALQLADEARERLEASVLHRSDTPYRDWRFYPYQTSAKASFVTHVFLTDPSASGPGAKESFVHCLTALMLRDTRQPLRGTDADDWMSGFARPEWESILLPAAMRTVTKGELEWGCFRLYHASKQASGRLPQELGEFIASPDVDLLMLPDLGCKLGSTAACNYVRDAHKVLLK